MVSVMTKIYIENNELDLSQGLSNLITYAIDDLQRIDSKTTAFSKTIIIPGTTRNNGLLGNIFEINNSNFTDDALNNVGYNFNASRQAKCRIEVNGLQIIKGVFRLMEIIIDGEFIEYECAVFGELGGFVAKVGNLRLEDLDFSAYDHVYAISGITDSWDNANSGVGFYYPLIDYGGVSTGAFGTAKHDYQYKTFRPALHTREYFDKIITGAGYTWESVFCNTDFFKRLIIPNNQKELYVPKSQIFYTTQPPLFSLDETNVGTDVFEDFLFIQNYVGGLFTTSDNKEFTYIGASANVSVTMFLSTLSIINTAFGQPQNFPGPTISSKIELIKNGNVVFWNNLTYGRSGYGQSPFVIYNEAPIIDLVTNDVISVRITTTTYAGGGINPVRFRFLIAGQSVTIDSQVPILSPAELGDTIRFNEIQPKSIFQKDFFASMLKMFNLMVSEDAGQEKHLVIEPRIDFYNTDPTSYEDWSHKVDRGRPIRVKPMSEINARYYELNYKADTDFYNDEYKKKYSEGYGNRIFDNGFDFAKETDKLEVIFAATPLVGYEGEDKVTPAIFKRNNALEDKVEHIIRIMQAKKITGVSSWDIMDNGIVLSSETDYPYAGHFDDPDVPASDINFGIPQQLYFELVSGAVFNNLFNIFYSAYFAEITDKDSRLLTMDMKLNEQDIYSLNFGRFKYIDGGLYRLQKLIDYNAGGNDNTKTELLRVIYTTY